VTLADLSRLAAQLDGVSESRREGLLHWRYRGRLVARQLDDSHIVIRASFEFRDFLLQSFPETFSVPKRFAKHMMVVARHSCAAFAFSLGMTPVEVSRLLRHSDPAVTLSVYAGLDDATVANLGEKLAAGLGGP
jgi:hypothetical protein